MSAIDAHTAASHGHDADHGHDHPPHLAHHFDTPEQQYNSAKIGMWVFLATEILMFGGLFCAYAVYRYNHPEVFRYSEHHLNTWLGATNTVVLLASSLTMALAVRAAQLGQQTYLKLMLIMTLFGAFGFMCIKAVEYTEKFTKGYVPGIENKYALEDQSTKDSYVTPFSGFVKKDGYGKDGKKESAAAVPNLGDNQIGDDDGIPASVPAMEDSDGGVTEVAERSEGEDAAIADSTQATEQTGQQLAFMGPSYVDPNFGKADAALVRPNFRSDYQNVGVAAGHHGDHHGVEYEDLNVNEKVNVKAFFSIYFMMTGLHGLHVLVGMGLIFSVLIKAYRGVFGPGYYTPVDLVGLYWHLVDLIWIFLFPLLYLIH